MDKPTKSKKNNCPHCAPYPPEHKKEWVGFLVDRFINVFDKIINRILQISEIENLFWNIWVKGLRLFRLGSFQKVNIDQILLSKKQKLVLKAGLELNYDIEQFCLFGKGTTTWRASRNEIEYIFDELPVLKARRHQNIS